MHQLRRWVMALIVLGVAAHLWAATPRSIYKAALKAVEDGDYAKAKRALELCLSKSPEPETVIGSKGKPLQYVPHLRLAEVLAGMGDVEGAQSALQESRRLGFAQQEVPEDFARVERVVVEAGGGEAVGVPTATAAPVPVVATETPPLATPTPSLVATEPPLPTPTPFPVATEAPTPTAVPTEPPLPEPTLVPLAPTPTPRPLATRPPVVVPPVFPAPVLAVDREVASADGACDLSWEPVDGVSSYVVQVSTNPDFADVEEHLSRLPFFLPDRDLEPGERLHFRVIAEGPEGRSEPSEVSMCWRPLDVLAAPLRLSPTTGTVAPGAMAEVSWERMEGATAYDVSARSGDDEVLSTQVTGATIAVPAPVSPCTMIVEVTPLVGGTSGLTSVSIWTVRADRAAPQLVYDATSRRLQWVPVQGAESYIVYYGEGGEASLLFASDVPCDDELCSVSVDEGLPAGRYTFITNAIDQARNFSPSMPVEVRVSSLAPEARAVLEEAKQAIVDLDYLSGLDILAANVDALRLEADFHLFLGIAAYYCSVLDDPIPEVFGTDPAVVSREGFRRAKAIDPALVFPIEEFDEDTKQSFDRAVGN